MKHLQQVTTEIRTEHAHELAKAFQCVETYSGFSLNQLQKQVLTEFIYDRMLAQNIPHLGSYIERLDSSPLGRQEIASLTARILNHETFIEREPHQMSLLFTDTLPRLFRRHKSVNIVCAGCSNGAEVYEVALLAKQVQQLEKPGSEFHVHGLDISEKMIQQARSGIISEHSSRLAKKAYNSRWISRHPDQGLQVEGELMKHVSFRRHNLMDSFPCISASLIICRNVLIYFNQASRSHCLHSFYRGLVKGGFLLLGSSESAYSHRDLFRRIDYPSTYIYERI